MKSKEGFFNSRTKKYLLMCVVATVGLLLIMLSFLPKNKQKDEENKFDTYIARVENRLKETVSNIKGAGKTSVFVSAESTFETVYESNASIDQSNKDSSTSKVTEKEIAYLQSSSKGQVPVVIKEMCPRISGVLVVCQGGNSAYVRTEIVNAVSVALGIQTNKIYVTGGTE